MVRPDTVRVFLWMISFVFSSFALAQQPPEIRALWADTFHAGMRTSAGLVSRTGSYSGWPQKKGSLGPMARTVKDLATLLDVIVGYDSEDPLMAQGFGHTPESFAGFLDKDGLRGVRLGIARKHFGFNDHVDKLMNDLLAEMKKRGHEL